MKLSKDMKIWIKQQALRKKENENHIELIKRNVIILKKLLKLAIEQNKCIDLDTKTAIKDWDKA